MWSFVIYDLNVEEIIGTFYEKELQKTNQQEFRVDKLIKKKGHKLYVKWEGYDNSYSSWIDKNYVIKNWVNTFLNHMNLLVETLI